MHSPVPRVSFGFQLEVRNRESRCRGPDHLPVTKLSRGGHTSGTLSLQEALDTQHLLVHHHPGCCPPGDWECQCAVSSAVLFPSGLWALPWALMPHPSFSVAGRGAFVYTTAPLRGAEHREQAVSLSSVLRTLSAEITI